MCHDKDKDEDKIAESMVTPSRIKVTLHANVTVTPSENGKYIAFSL